MPVYNGTIQLEGDPNVLPAVITVDDGRIVVSSRNRPIGNWTLASAGFRRAREGVVLSVNEGVLLIKAENPESFARAVGLRDENKATERRTQFSQPAAWEQDDEPQKESRSAEEVAREIAADLNPYVSEVREGLSQIKLDRNQWIGVGVGVVLAIVFPSVSVFILSIVGAVAVLAGGIGLLEPSFESRFPEHLSPVRVLAIGMAAFLLAAIVLIVR
ncbi:MAG TPA: hypothetical protein VIW46_07135 [Acidimicrobiia bacterium]